MGIDVEIYFKAEKGSGWDNAKTVLGTVKINDDTEFTEPTHNISSMVRLYSQNYARGPWPQISSVLMELLADPEVSKIWYGGDCDDPENIPEFTREKLFELSDFYLDNMDSPYRDAFK